MFTQFEFGGGSSTTQKSWNRAGKVNGTVRNN